MSKKILSIFLIICMSFTTVLIAGCENNSQDEFSHTNSATTYKADTTDNTGAQSTYAVAGTAENAVSDQPVNTSTSSATSTDTSSTKPTDEGTVTPTSTAISTPTNTATAKPTGTSNTATTKPTSTATIKPTGTPQTVSISKNDIVFEQCDAAWESYDPGNGAGCTIAKNGCGLMSIVNAIYYLNGNIVDIKELGDWAYSNGYYGTSGTYRWTLYPNLAAKFGAKYGFTTPVSWKNKTSAVTEAELVNHLKNGGVAIGHVERHFICIADYDTATGRFLILDSSPNYELRFTSSGGSWLSISELTTDSQYMNVDGYCLISPATSNVTKHKATISIESGSGYASFGNDINSASFGAGSTVFLRVVPASGYKVSSITVNGTSIAIQNSGKPYSYKFTMPAKDATVKIKFATGGSTQATKIDIAALSFDVSKGIIVRSDAWAPNAYAGMFTSNTTTYTKDTAVFYYSIAEYTYTQDGGLGTTRNIQSGDKGGNVAAYGAGNFKILIFDTSGNIISNVFNITLTGTTTHATALTYVPQGHKGNNDGSGTI